VVVVVVVVIVVVGAALAPGLAERAHARAPASGGKFAVLVLLVVVVVVGGGGSRVGSWRGGCRCVGGDGTLTWPRRECRRVEAARGRCPRG